MDGPDTRGVAATAGQHPNRFPRKHSSHRTPGTTADRTSPTSEHAHIPFMKQLIRFRVPSRHELRSPTTGPTHPPPHPPPPTANPPITHHIPTSTHIHPPNPIPPTHPPTGVRLSVGSDVSAAGQDGRGDDRDVQLGRLPAVEGHLSEGEVGQGGLAGDEAGQTRSRIHRRVHAESPMNRACRQFVRRGQRLCHVRSHPNNYLRATSVD